LLINELTADRDTEPSGVTLQVQQEISSSCGPNVYKLMQKFWDVPIPGASKQTVPSLSQLPLVVAPALVKLINESPTFKLAA